MTTSGIPVPIRALAAAGGFNLDEILGQTEDDLDLRRRIKEYKDEIKKISPPAEGEAEGEGGEFGSFGSASPLLSVDPTGSTKSTVRAVSGRKPHLFSRKFTEEQFDIKGRTKTGKPKAIYSQSRAQKRANEMIGKALTNIVKNKKTPLSCATVTEKTVRNRT
jgi:hypothetical protein